MPMPPMSETTQAAMREAIRRERLLFAQIQRYDCPTQLRLSLVVIATIHEPTQRIGWDGAWCTSCPQTRYPCKTVEALEEGTR